MHPFPPTAVTITLSFFSLAVFYCSSDPSLTLPSPPYIPPKVIMDIADMIIEDFLYQNVFTTYDYFCPLPKSVSLCEHRSCMRIASQTSNARHPSFYCYLSFFCLSFLLSFLSAPSSTHLFKCHQSLHHFNLLSNMTRISLICTVLDRHAQVHHRLVRGELEGHL